MTIASGATTAPFEMALKMFDSNQSKSRVAEPDFTQTKFGKAPHVELRQKELPKSSGGHLRIKRLLHQQLCVSNETIVSFAAVTPPRTGITRSLRRYTSSRRSKLRSKAMSARSLPNLDAGQKRPHRAMSENNPPEPPVPNIRPAQGSGNRNGRYNKHAALTAANCRSPALLLILVVSSSFTEPAPSLSL